MDMLLGIRTDANSKIGLGHVMRCLVLARKWKENGGRVLFITCGAGNETIKKIKLEGHDVRLLPTPHPETDDRVLTLKYLENAGVPVLLTDGYHFTETYHRHIRENGIQLMVVDDTNHLPFYRADAILNANFAAETLTYTCEPGTRLLLGPAYSLLREEFTRYRRDERPTAAGPDARHILVTLGGGDTDNISLKVIRALNRLANPDLHVKLVCGSENPHAKPLAAALQQSVFRHDLIFNTDNMAGLMDWADTGICAGGGTAKEMCYMGVPAVYLVLADNQRPGVAWLEKKGAGLTAGEGKKISVSVLADKIGALIADGSLRRKISFRALACMPDGAGLGTDKIIRVLREMHDYPAR